MIEFKTLLPHLSDLASVPQNPKFHGEGDVLTHTKMVMDSLAAQAEYQALPRDDQALLMTAAALHDLGKQATTRREDGEWTSPYHSTVGASMARALLLTGFQLGGTAESLCKREAICELVRLHMKPLHALEGKDPERTIRKMASTQALAPAFSLKKLALLSRADVLGRICADQKEKLEAVALFEALAQELKCAESPFEYPDAYSRFADFSGRNIAPGQRLFNDSWGTVVMLSGLPGTGKDTWARANLPGKTMVSLDDVRREMNIRPTDDQGSVVQAARERCRVLLRAHQPFVFNATNLSAMMRGKWISLFHQYRAMVRLVYLEAPFDVREARNRNRAEAVPEEAVHRMLRQLELPLLTEAEEVEWLCV